MFWKETLFYFSEFIESFNLHSLSEPLWYNNKIKIQNKYAFCKPMFDKGFHIVHDLFNTEGNFISYESITNDYFVKLPFTTYEGLKQSILTAWPNIKQYLYYTVVKPYQPEFVKTLCKNRKGSRNIYDYLMAKTQHRPIFENKWDTDLKLELNFDWKHVYANFKLTTKDSGLMWFNYRIIH